MSFFDNLNTYNDSHERAFEALGNQLFERWVRANNPNSVKYFSVVNGSGGDGQAANGAARHATELL